MTSIHIITGSVMGTALEVATGLESLLYAEKHQVRRSDNFSQGPAWHNPEEVVLICTSNTGMGDLPANILPFYHYLKTANPSIYRHRYAIVNLGDSTYPNFAQAGRTLDETLLDLGALRLGELLTIDAQHCDTPVLEATSWFKDWKQNL